MRMKPIYQLARWFRPHQIEKTYYLLLVAGSAFLLVPVFHVVLRLKTGSALYMSLIFIVPLSLLLLYALLRYIIIDFRDVVSRLRKLFESPH